jgi:hypothetical protein
MNSRYLSKALLVSSIALLPACSITDWFSKHTPCTDCDGKHTSTIGAPVQAALPVQTELDREVLVSFDNKPAVTAADYEKNIQLLSNVQPAFKDMLPFMPADQQDQIFEQIAENLATERIIQEWVKRGGIDKTPEYQENARQVYEAVNRDLAMRAFEQDIIRHITITDEDAQKYYEENKDKLPIFKRAPFVASLGGVRAQTVTAANEKEANDIADKARKSSLAAAAKEAKKTVDDLGLVTTQSTSLEPDVKVKVLAIKKFPDVIVVKSGKNQWKVIEATARQEPQQAPYDEVKDQVKQILLRDKFTDAYNKKMAELKSEFKVSVNKDYLKKRKRPTPPELPTQTAPAGEAQAPETVKPEEPQARPQTRPAPQQVTPPTRAA